MKRKLLIKLGAPMLAISLVAACGTGNEQDPAENEAPLNQEEDGGMMEDDGQNGDMNQQQPEDNLNEEE
ncbi:hypothetical protein [Oceanobacillus damuensis]|uniref:hypothetical protein n=1 Tax=Oceanobacillus damuensis TaxID=937928 RepID=UPI00082EA29D|nr:hypothetical protein [Oceanobacillus damuensis]